MVIGKHLFNTEPVWYIGEDQPLENVKCLEILGVSFNSDGRSSDHVNTRISKCHKAFYGLRDAGMAYPGAHTSIKKYLWKTICLPTLLYGMECINISKNELTRLERTQGNHIKQCLGLGKTVHSTHILQALNVRKIVNNLSAKCLMFYHSVFNNETPATKLNRFFLSRYVASGRLIPGTLISNIVRDGYSPMSVLFNKPCKYTSSQTNCGITESLHNLLYHENFIKPYSEEKYLVYLLTKSF